MTAASRRWAKLPPTEQTVLTLINTRPTQVLAEAMINTIATRTKRYFTICGSTFVTIDLEAKKPSKNY